MALPALPDRRTRVFRAVQDPRVGCQSYGAWALWLLGYPDQALRRSQEAMTRAQELSHPFSEAFAFFFASVLHYLRREVQTTGERAEKAIMLCQKHGFALYLGQAMITRGWALVGQGQGQEGVVLMRQGLAAQQKTGADLGLPDFLTLLAEAYGTMG